MLEETQGACASRAANERKVKNVLIDREFIIALIVVR